MAIVNHAVEGGLSRYLIYDRLGFRPDAYVPLYSEGGMTISNEVEFRDRHDGPDGGGMNDNPDE